MDELDAPAAFAGVEERFGGGALASTYSADGGRGIVRLGLEVGGGPARARLGTVHGWRDGGSSWGFGP